MASYKMVVVAALLAIAWGAVSMVCFSSIAAVPWSAAAMVSGR